MNGAKWSVDNSGRLTQSLSDNVHKTLSEWTLSAVLAELSLRLLCPANPNTTQPIPTAIEPEAGDKRPINSEHLYCRSDLLI